MSKTGSPSSIQRVAAEAIGLAGIIHVLLAPSHWQHAPAHGIFFLLAGLLEIGWAVAYIWNSSEALSYLGIALAGSLIVLWILTRAMPAPFGHGPEAMDATGIVCKLSEIVGMAALCALAYQSLSAAKGKRAASWALVSVLLAGVALGAFAYVTARAAERYLPSLAIHQQSEENQHEDGQVGEEATGKHEHEPESGSPVP